MHIRAYMCACLVVVVAALMAAPARSEALGESEADSALYQQAAHRFRELQQRVSALELRDHISRRTRSRVGAGGRGGSDARGSVSGSAATRGAATRGAGLPPRGGAMSIGPRSSGVNEDDRVPADSQSSAPVSSGPIRPTAAMLSHAQRPEPAAAAAARRDEPKDAIENREVKDVSLAMSTCMELQQYIIDDYVLGRLAVDVRRLDALFQVDPERAHKMFSKVRKYAAEGTTWLIGVGATLTGVHAIKGVVDAAIFIKGMYEHPLAVHKFIEGVTKDLAEEGPAASLLVFPDATFGCLNDATKGLREGFLRTQPTMALITQKMKELSESWGAASSAVAHVSNKALNHVIVKAAFWIGEGVFLVLDLCTLGATVAPHAVYAGVHVGHSVASKGASIADEFNLQSKLEFILLRLYLMEALFTGERGFEFPSAPAAAASAASAADRPRVTRCAITSTAENHGCDARTWCQIEQVFLTDHVLNKQGRGYCFPTTGVRPAPEGSECMDHADCSSAFCHRPYRVGKLKHAEGAKAALVGTCRVAALRSVEGSEAIDYYEFGLRPLSREVARAAAGTGVHATSRDEDPPKYSRQCEIGDCTVQ